MKPGSPRKEPDTDGGGKGPIKPCGGNWPDTGGE